MRYFVMNADKWWKIDSKFHVAMYSSGLKSVPFLFGKRDIAIYQKNH